MAAEWFRDRSTALTNLDPDAPLDDLEPLREIVGDARVVAVGESSHFIREFHLARARILRFLAERCDFTVFAVEFGFSIPWPATSATSTRTSCRCSTPPS